MHGASFTRSVQQEQLEIPLGLVLDLHISEMAFLVFDIADEMIAVASIMQYITT